MKLRNKKTGEICELASIRQYWREEKDGGVGYCLLTSLVDGGEQFIYNSLAELNEEWEDYQSAEPLIKDEKIRKAVRAWAEANEIERVWHECSSCWLRGDGLQIEMENEVTELEQGNYAIAELCGNGEE